MGIFSSFHFWNDSKGNNSTTNSTSNTMAPNRHPDTDVDVPVDGEEEDNIMTCPDGHSCENGSLCVENALKEGQYFCDCDESDLAGMKVFTGIYCQHEATIYCTPSGERSSVGFCANGGICQGVVDGKTHDHVGCECPEGYTGKHCQFVEGSVPDGYPLENANMKDFGKPSSALNSNSSDGGMGAGATAATILSLVVALALMGTALYVILKRYRQHAASHVVEPSGSPKASDGHLHNPNGDDLDLSVMPTQSYESNDTHEDQSELQLSESAEMA